MNEDMKKLLEWEKTIRKRLPLPVRLRAHDANTRTETGYRLKDGFQPALPGL